MGAPDPNPRNSIKWRHWCFYYNLVNVEQHNNPLVNTFSLFFELVIQGSGRGSGVPISWVSIVIIIIMIIIIILILILIINIYLLSLLYQ